MQRTGIEKMEEIYRDIEGYEGLYRISNRGKVYSLISKKHLKQQKASKGGKYLQVFLHKNKKQKAMLVHRLVAEAFLEDTDIEDAKVRHTDGNRHNNCAENLEYYTLAENIQHAYEKGAYAEANRKSSSYRSKVSKLTFLEVAAIKDALKNGYGTNTVAKMYKTNRSTVGYIKQKMSYKDV